MKRRVVEEMQRGRQQSQADANRAIDEVFDGIASVLAAGEPVSIPGFGTFRSQYRDTRKSRNPKTGESITVQGRDVIKFKEPRIRAR